MLSQAPQLRMIYTDEAPPSGFDDLVKAVSADAGTALEIEPGRAGRVTFFSFPPTRATPHYEHLMSQA